MTAKQPLSFDLESVEPAAKPGRAPAKSRATKAEPQGSSDVERKQVGARIPVALYRKLKAHAALNGVAVQEMVEAAVADYLSRHAGSA